MAKHDILLGAMLAGIGATMIAVARGFPPIAGLAVGPSLFPILIGGGMVAAGVAIAAAAWRTARGGGAGHDRPAGETFLTWNLALVSGLIVIFLAMVERTGFSIACFLIIFALLRVYHRERLMTDLVLTAVSVVVVFILFSSVFRVSLPVGPVELLVFKIIG